MTSSSTSFAVLQTKHFLFQGHSLVHLCITPCTILYPPPLSDIFLLNFIICTSNIIIFILLEFFHIYYFEILFIHTSTTQNIYLVFFVISIIFIFLGRFRSFAEPPNIFYLTALAALSQSSRLFSSAT